MTKRLSVGLVCLALFQPMFAYAKPVDETIAKNIIFVIVDGMGPAQIEAAEIYLNQKIRFRNFPYQGTVTTHNADKQVTDSAAAATAMATGQKVANEVISQRVPGDGSDIKTMLERAKDMGKSTGLVTTTLFTDATPAAFGAHASGRSNTEEILKDYFSASQPNVVFGGDEPSFREAAARSDKPYLMATSSKELDKQTAAARKIGRCDAYSCPRVYGGFGSHPIVPGFMESWKAIPLEATPSRYFTRNDIPHLSTMAKSALDILSQNRNGFFLMIESGLVDWIGHLNRLFREDAKVSAAFAYGKEFEELNRTLDVILNFLAKNPDTLVVVTADHETGGLEVDRAGTKCVGKRRCLPKLKWTSSHKVYKGEEVANHSDANVGFFATGKNAQVFATPANLPMDNTEFVSKLFQSAKLGTD